MKIGLYLRQLISIGGGNLHSLAIAEHLSRSHQVDIITHTPYGASQTLPRFDVDLSRAHLRLVPAPAPLHDEEKLAALTAEYDLFINRVHNVLMPCRAPRCVLLVLFPMPVHLSPLGRLRRRAARWLQARILPYRFQAGVYGEEHLGSDRMWLLASRAELGLASSRFPYRVSFRVRSLATQAQQVDVWRDGQLQERLAIPAGAKSPPCRVVIPPGAPGRGHCLVLESPAGPTRERFPVGAMGAADGPEARGFPLLALTDFRLSHPAHRLYRQLFETWLPHWRDRLLNPLPDDPAGKLATYDAVWSISEFTRRWTRAYWQRESTVIHPAIDVDAVHPLPKKPWILSVGRFFVALHNKKHLAMVEAFKEMCRQGLEGWALHLAGEVIDNPVHRAYLRQVQEAAQGYPIHIHTNAPRAQLLDLYGRSAIYWHAAGYGADENTQPEKFEHFGITTVEAMAAGCAPVVIDRGGQPEIVVHGESGFVWRTLAELQGYTRRLIEDQELYASVSAAARSRSRKFDRSHFRAQVDAALREMF